MTTIALTDRVLISLFFGTGALPFFVEQKAATTIDTTTCFSSDDKWLIYLSLMNWSIKLCLLW
jgi:hypothetical protein